MLPGSSAHDWLRTKLITRCSVSMSPWGHWTGGSSGIRFVSAGVDVWAAAAPAHGTTRNATIATNRIRMGRVFHPGPGSEGRQPLRVATGQLGSEPVGEIDRGEEL